MTTNFRKIWGILFLAAMTAMSAPSGAWGQKLGDNDNAKIESAVEFAKNHGATSEQILKLENSDSGSNQFPCGSQSCDLTKEVCIHNEVDAVGAVRINHYHFCQPKDKEIPTSDDRNKYEICSSGCTNSYEGKGSQGGIDYLSECFTGGTPPKKYCIFYNSSSATIEYGNVDGGFKGCEVLPVKLYNQRKCFFCPLFKVLFTAADDMAKTSFEKLGTAFKSLIGIGLALWIAVQTLAHVSSLTKQDAPKFLGGLIKQSAKFLIAFLLLANSGEIYRLGVNPLLQAGLKFGGELASSNVSVSDKTIIEYNKIVDPGTTYFSTNNGSLYVDIAIFISKVQYEIAFMQAVGSSLLCIGGHGMFSPTGGKLGFGDGFQMAIQGLLLVAFGLLLSLAFAFYLIDAVVQLGIVGALMPFLIACWPFKITSSYTGKGVQILLNSFFVFVFIGLVIRVNLDLVDAGIKNTVTTASTETSGGTDANKDNKDENAEKALGGLLPIYNAVNNQDTDKLKELTDISTVGFLILIVCCLFGFKLSGKAEELAGKMAGGAISGIGSSIGTMATSATKGAALKTTAPIRKAAWNKTKDIAKATPGAIGRGARAIKNKLTGQSGNNGNTPTIRGSTPSSLSRLHGNGGALPKTPTIDATTMSSTVVGVPPSNQPPKPPVDATSEETLTRQNQTTTPSVTTAETTHSSGGSGGNTPAGAGAAAGSSSGNTPKDGTPSPVNTESSTTPSSDGDNATTANQNPHGSQANEAEQTGNDGTKKRRPNRGSNPNKGADPRKAGKRKHALSMQQHTRQEEMRKKIKLGSGKSRQKAINKTANKGGRGKKRK